MDVFRSFPSIDKTITKKKVRRSPHNNGLIYRDQSDKPFKSEREIRGKLDGHLSKSAPKSRPIKGRKMGMSYLEGDGEVVGDIKKNDPNDPMTKEKLKTLLTSGAVNFGDKERAVLSKILKN